MARLVLEHQGHRTEFEVTSLATIGRQATNDIMVLTEKASRRHARVVSAGKHFLVEDLNSSNGTLVNDVKVQRHALKDGDVIRIGEAKITFLEAQPVKETQSVNLEGEVLGNYRIHNRIGQGAMGSVYKATQISMDRIVALKILKSELTSDRDFVRAFLQEARTAGKLNHPNIVRVHDFGEAGGVYYFSMEYVNGETLEDVLKRDGKIPVERTLEVVRAVAEALEHAHGIGVLHRDIKPQNILVDTRGQVKVTDLGLARATRSDPEARKRSVMGTPHYMAPETAEQRRFDEKTDIYSLGVTMFHMLTGRVPYDGANSLAVLAKHVNEPVPSPRTLEPQIPEPVSRLVEVMMAKNPGLRPASAKSLVRAVDEARKKAKNAPPPGARASRSPRSERKTDTPPIPLDRPAGWKASSSPSKAKPSGARSGPSAPLAPPLPGGPLGPRVKIIKVGGGSPVLYMLIGAFAIAILGVIAWVVVTGRSQGGGSRGGSPTSGTSGSSRRVPSARMSGSEAGRKLKEADAARVSGQRRLSEDLCKEIINRCADPRWVGRAWEVLAKLDEAALPLEVTGRVTSAADPGREREASARLAEIEGELESNPQGKFLVARKLVLFIRTYRGTRASERAKDILRRLYGGKLPVDLERIISAGPPRTPAGDTTKRPPKEVLKEACDASDEAFRREDYHESRSVLVRAVTELQGTPQAADAAEALDRRESRIRQELARILGRGIALSRRQRYAEAGKLLRDVMRQDPIGKDRERAAKLLEANEEAARSIYERVLARARPSMDECAFDKAGQELRSGLAELTGTRWHGKLETLALSVEMSRGLIERFAKKVSATRGSPLDVTVALRGKHQMKSAKLVRAGPAGITLAEGRVQTTIAWKKLSPDELCRTFGLFRLTPDDRVGLGAFFSLRGEKQLARGVLEEIRQDPTVQGKVGFLLRELDRSEKIKRFDFSRPEQVDEIAFTGSWSVADGKLLHDDSKVGTATLGDAGGEVHYRGDGFDLSFEVVFLEEEGAIEVQLGADSDSCVWFNLGSAGYQAQSSAGGRTQKVEGPWTVRTGHPHAVTCRIAGDTLTVTSDRKAMRGLTLPGLGLLEGPVTFRAQGARLALDNIVARQKDRSPGP